MDLRKKIFSPRCAEAIIVRFMIINFIGSVCDVCCSFE